MWGIRLAPATRPAAWAHGLGRQALMGLGPCLRAGNRIADSYVATAPFEDNLLTTDRDDVGLHESAD